MSLELPLQWVEANQALLAWLGVASALVFIVSLSTVPWFVARIPTDYFHADHRRALPWAQHHPVIRWPLLVLKNAAGLLFLAAGIAMLVLPGQGLLTMLAGILLLNFPGKYRFERWLVSRPTVFSTVNWLRQRRGQPPLRL